MAEADLNDGPAPVYLIELRAEAPIAMDHLAIQREMREGLGEIDVSQPHHFFLRGFPVQLKDAEICAQVFLLSADRQADAGELEQTLNQSWSLTRARDRHAATRYSVVLSDLHARLLGHRQRQRILSVSLRAVLRHSNVGLVHFVPTQQLRDAREVLGQLDDADQQQNPTAGFVNVRFYKVGDRFVMDTLGLTALGLTDLQIDYRDLDPTGVAGSLQSLARYLLEHGDVIESGHTVDGLTPGSTWHCEHERSLMKPFRTVIDLDPGTGVRAGRRGQP